MAALLLCCVLSVLFFAVSIASSPDYENITDIFEEYNSSIPEVEPQGSLGFCQLYRGVTCVQYIGNRSVYVKPPLTLSLMEEKLTAAFTVVATSHDVSDECHKYAIPSLCFFAFPLCDTDSPYPIPRQVCRDECEVLESNICRMEYSIAKRHPLLGQQKILPVCEELPPVGSKESETCMRLGIPSAVIVDRADTCFEGNGENYRGTMSTTVSGYKCQPWSDQIFYKTADYPELVGGHSYCRNPGGKETQPWCFTNDPSVRKELCNVPQCGQYHTIEVRNITFSTDQFDTELIKYEFDLKNSSIMENNSTNTSTSLVTEDAEKEDETIENDVNQMKIEEYQLKIKVLQHQLQFLKEKHIEDLKEMKELHGLKIALVSKQLKFVEDKQNAEINELKKLQSIKIKNALKKHF